MASVPLHYSRKRKDRQQPTSCCTGGEWTEGTAANRPLYLERMDRRDGSQWAAVPGGNGQKGWQPTGCCAWRGWTAANGLLYQKGEDGSLRASVPREDGWQPPGHCTREKGRQPMGRCTQRGWTGMYGSQQNAIQEGQMAAVPGVENRDVQQPMGRCTRRRKVGSGMLWSGAGPVFKYSPKIEGLEISHHQRQ
ncbi:uncharacterized protein LOC120353237 [Nilaparvata lugens]|uniref:uncharacterized protein LOC120353237 n=1 Tax=Nilaparvata lugens TaxID=108931 RepID=UPI00193D7C70|nr:uncharacterized protein LOC120353237 [Nilaparvata lugens]